MRHFSGEFSGVRLLMADELSQIAGGDGEDTDDTAPPVEEIEEIIVDAQPLPPDYFYSPPIIIGGGDYSGGGDAGPEDDYPDTPDTPCVETGFASSSVSIDRVNNAAKAAADAIVATGNSGTWEYGAFIYEYGGQVLFTPIFTNQRHNSVDFSSNSVPSGAHVLAMIHNQPSDPLGTADQRLPSPEDWQAYDTLAGQSVAGRTFDSNMLTYILTNQDGQTRPYDNTDKNQSSPSCGF
jgi:hypothetical protein